ncbi:MAG: DUF1566 domain-containing protein [Burkholderiales bacterium]|nr:DUF1566 domain-containing protein [Burkholderiales bacterium]MBH1993849.1 DUF1566 domain-containing protein [Burkholderiales bacterium]MBH2069905.1 DUF1566 domain-containing protein [Burkholderiales bacterium]
MSALTITLPAEHANIIFDALLDSRGFSREMSVLPGADMSYWNVQIEKINAAYAAMTLANLGQQVTQATLGAPFGGGIYAGIMRGVGDAPDEHLVLLPGEAVDVDWEAACAFATSVGGELPTRAEQALLFANLKDQFQPRWYWSGEQAGPSFAWSQDFDGGHQYTSYRSYEGRARAVRRLPI